MQMTRQIGQIMILVALNTLRITEFIKQATSDVLRQLTSSSIATYSIDIQPSETFIATQSLCIGLLFYDELMRNAIVYLLEAFVS
ncbi:MAG: hypothetical protein DHS20C13_29460 [Thermodesulfobacteriota bacterium]|nr:MAG: hypothetical protein DHS20C13_29460 [Thermodesulfobacteriota bacterium]